MSRMLGRKSGKKSWHFSAISRTAFIAIIIVIILILAGAGYYALTLGGTSSTTTSTTSSTSTTSGTSTTSSTLTTSSSITSTTTTSSSSISTTESIPPSFTWETSSNPATLDPGNVFAPYDDNVLENVYESLLWYNGSSSTQVIPWLAQNYTISSDGKNIDFTLRSGISFQDGETLNATAVYFSLNRLLMEDGSLPGAHGAQAAWIVQQLLNTSLSTTLSGTAQAYNQTWVNEVLAQNFVQVTGPLTFTLHILNPRSDFPYILAGQWAEILAPSYVMQHDIGTWNQSNNGYTLPYQSLSGNESAMIYQYFLDLVATCNSGSTPSGCGATYLFTSYQGSDAGTGPYAIQSFGQSTNNIELQANPSYWGGPYQYSGGTKIVPQIHTIKILYVPNFATRILDLKNGISSGYAIAVDIPPDHLYDVADRSSWLSNHQLVSIIPGLTLYQPSTTFSVGWGNFDENVTNQFTGQKYAFQPFADLRVRLAFADSVDISAVNQNFNNGLGQAALNLIPPGVPPAGAFNSSVVPRYSFNLTGAQNLLVDAMLHQLTSFTQVNGTAAPAGLYNNTFGCTSLNSNQQCDNPVPQNVPLVYIAGDTFSGEIVTEIASAINNISSTYNMGLIVNVDPVPAGLWVTELVSGSLYFSLTTDTADYPYVTDFLATFYPPGSPATAFTGWNITQMQVLWSQMKDAVAIDNVTQILALNDAMNSLANHMVMYLWTIYPDLVWRSSAIADISSNVHGYYFNPSIDGMYFASLY